MQKHWVGFFSFCAVAAGSLAFNEHQPVRDEQPITNSYGYTPISIEVRDPKTVFGIDVDGLAVVEDKVKKNQFLADILMSYNVPVKYVNQVSAVPRKLFDVRKVAVDKKYTVICQTDSLKTAKAIIYEPNPIDYVVFTFDDTLHVDVCKREVVVEEKSIAGIILSSLSQTINEMGISHELTNKFVDVFAWQVDFQRLQKGDVFKLVYEEIQVEGRPIGIGEIKGIYFEHFSSPYYAIPFDQGGGKDYFDDHGKSLRKALLKYPIEFTRISSRYTGRRFHPVQKIFKPHLGTDFAAATGTPIRSVGDGIVEEAQYKSNNGNYVKIRHNGTYTTQYLHMSRIEPGIHAGMRVRQGQRIGYVGSTGLATGPHLCYRFWKNGKQVDALRVELPPSQPIKTEFAEAYQHKKEQVKLQLDAIPSPVQEAMAKAF
ncbi:MAG: peptidoglycan DD-metalloendopeptidase family protein [Cyclobacteriaceae bacterium]